MQELPLINQARVLDYEMTRERATARGVCDKCRVFRNRKKPTNKKTTIPIQS